MFGCFSKPPLTKVAADELYDAERKLLEWQHSVEAHEMAAAAARACAETMAKRVERLKAKTKGLIAELPSGMDQPLGSTYR